LGLFESARFFTSVAHLADLPATAVPEIAFAGRSNVGKSSVINALVRRKRLAIASKTPGRTRLLNFFTLTERDAAADELRAFLVDLPGYGFARAARESREQWDELVGGYVGTRPQLAGMVVVVDARRGLGAADEELFEFVGSNRFPLHVLLNKSDHLNRVERRQALASAERRANRLAGPASVQLFSALKHEGVAELEQVLATMIGRE
jgi:GTP-binding protein